MRVAVFSDIHGNVRGLQACLDDLRTQGGADAIVGAGDFCMDGPRPREVLELLNQRGARCVRGNTDRYIVNSLEEEDDCGSIGWQRAQLGPAWLRWLEELPFSLEFGSGDNRLLVVHANPRNDDEHVWPDADDATLRHFFEGVSASAVAFGHLHLPYARVWRGKLLVNVASAGLPKDGDPRVNYAILTERAGGWEVKQRRIPFDIAKVERDLKKSGIPGVKKRLEVLRRHRYKQLGDLIP